MRSPCYSSSPVRKIGGSSSSVWNYRAAAVPAFARTQASAGGRTSTVYASAPQQITPAFAAIAAPTAARYRATAPDPDARAESSSLHQHAHERADARAARPVRDAPRSAFSQNECI